jgi:Family of unknown function (DUF6580)
MLKPRFLMLLAITLAAAASRLLPHPPNFAPISAMALFGGCYFTSRRAAFAIPLTVMFLSDLALGYGFHPVLPFVYGSFTLIVCLGLWVRQRRTPLTIGAAAFTASVLFFVVTNFGVWLLNDLYPMTLEGLVRCYVMAIPFFRNTLAGDAFYTLALFGGFALAQTLFPALREPVATAPARA